MQATRLPLQQAGASGIFLAALNLRAYNGTA